MDREDLINYLEEVKDRLLKGRIITGYEKLHFVIDHLKSDQGKKEKK